MESPNGSEMTTEQDLGGYASSARSLEPERSRSGSSPTSPSTSDISIGEHSLLSPITNSSFLVASPPTFVTVSGIQYTAGEVRAMADTVTKARKASELPPTQSSPFDSQAIIEDYTLLAKLRLARGDPALPPPKKYTNLRVEISRRIRERDAALEDEESQRDAMERVEGYLRVAGQEQKYYELAKETAKGRGVDCQGRDMKRVTEEVMGVVEKGIGTTAESLGLTATELDSVACLFNTIARSLAPTASTLSIATTSFDTTASTLKSTADTLENTLGVMATQINTLNSQLLVLTDTLQAQRRAPTFPISPTQLGARCQTQQTALEDSVRRGVEQAICEAMHNSRASTSRQPQTPGVKSPSYSGSTLDEGDPLSDCSSESARSMAESRSRRDADGKARKRAGKYVKIVFSRILG